MLDHRSRWSVRIAVLLTAVGAVHVSILAQGQQEIAFVAGRDGNWEIYRMRGDGSAQARLTHNDAEDTSPRWSPDGTRILFLSDRDGNHEIYSMAGDGSGQVNLTSNPAMDYNHRWSPDGDMIVFVRDMGDNNQDIWTMDPSGNNQRDLTPVEGIDRWPEWSPDGDWILFQSFRSGSPQIWKVPRDGGAALQLSTSRIGAGDARWSPDGKWIVYGSDHSGDPEIWTMRADGREHRQLTQAAGMDRDPHWSPDGRHILFKSERDGNQEIYRMAADGSGQVNLTRNPAADIEAVWSDDGAQILFRSDRDGHEEVYAMDFDGGNPRALSRAPAADWNAVFGPRIEAPPPPVAATPAASGLICFERTVLVESRQGIFLINPDGSGMRELPNTAFRPEDPTFSPDRTRIAYSRATSARRPQQPWERPPTEQLVTCDLQGGNLVVVAEGGWFYDLNWSADGTRILFRFLPQAAWDSDYVPRYWWVPATGGEWQELPVKALDAAVSPNGRDIVWSVHADPPSGARDYAAYLWVTDINGNNARQLTTGDDAVHGGAAYSPDGSTIAFYRRKLRDTSYEVRLIPANGTGPMRTVFQQAEGYRLDSELAWSPDGGMLLLSSGHVAEAKQSLYIITSSPPARFVIAPFTDARGIEWRCDWR